MELSDLRHLMRDSRMWFAIGIVTKPDDGEAVEVSTTDVLVEVLLQPSLQPVTCRLPARVWAAPDVGDEVMVGLPEGALEFMPVIVGVLSGGSVPSVQGPQTGRIVIERNEVLVHDGSGGAVALALKSDVDSHKTTYDVHTHLDPVSGTTSGPSAPFNSATGTSVFKAK